MLLELKVTNLAIIESVEIRWDRGLNILTGETGAGKSILLEALNLILGGRSDRSLVRTGQKEAWVEGLFEMDEAIQQQLEEWGIEASLDEPLALRRIVQSNGRSRAYVNCVSVPANHIKKLASQLVDFGRQHDQAILLNPENHLDLLDRFAQAEEERERVALAHQEVAALIRERKQLYETRHQRADRMEFLQYQQEAIIEVDPQPGEEQSLTDEIAAISQKQKQKELADKAAKMLYVDEDSVREHLNTALSPVEDLEKLDEEGVGTIVEDLHQALLTIEEAGRSLRSYADRLRHDEAHAESLRERLDDIIKLQERYGGDFDSVMERLDDIETELDELATKKKRATELDELIEDAQDRLAEAAGPLTEKRLAFAQKLTERVERELDELAMAGTRFVVKFRPLTHEGVACIWEEDPLAFPVEELAAASTEQPEGEEQQAKAEVTEAPQAPEEEATLFFRVSSSGAERAYFYLAANQGEELRPLERVASGGELSRILLSLKRVLAGASTVQTFVFDEIDSGVGGAAATMVAKKLRQIASDQGGEGAQILCISHTPQIAAEADAHLHVSKHTQDGRTRSRVRRLEHEQRVDEIARMLAGDQSTEQAIDLARKLLQSSSQAPIPEEAPSEETRNAV